MKPPRPKGVLLAVGLVAGILVVTGVFATVGAIGGDGTGSTEAGIEVGDCFVGRPIAEDVVDCEERHDGEVYVVESFDETGDEFPGRDEVLGEASRACLRAFEDYVGTGFLDSRFNFEPHVPDEDAWEEDDVREFVCALVDVSGEPLEGSGRGSGE